MLKVQDVLKTDHIIRVSPNEPISSVVSKLSSSHDAAFAFSQDKKFLGLINPYHCLIRNSLPGNAKAERCIFHPPKIGLHYPIQKIINLIVQSKIHYLPVFDDKSSFKGIISARHILEALKNDSRFNVSISQILNKKNKQALVTIYEHDTIITALHLFKQYKVSKLIVMSKDLKLKGILTYYDMIHFLISPKEKLHFGEREGNKNGFYSQSVKRFMKTYVLTLGMQDSMQTALKMVLEKKIGSIVVVDHERHPIGIITSRDFFNILTTPHSGLQVQLFKKDLSKQSIAMVNSFFKQFSTLVKNFPNLAEAKLSVKEEKQGGVFKVLMSLFPKKGSPEIYQREGKNLKYLLNEVKEGIKNQHSKI